MAEVRHMPHMPCPRHVLQSLFQFFWAEHVSIPSAGMLIQRLVHRQLEKPSWKGKRAGPVE